MENKISFKKIIIIIAIAMVVLLGLLYIVNTLSVRDLETDKFFEQCGIVYQKDGDDVKIEFNKPESGAIGKITIDGYNITGYEVLEKNNKTYYAKKYKTSYARSSGSYFFSDNVIDILKANGVEVDFEDPNAGSLLSSLIMPLLIFVVGIIIISIFTRQINGSNRSAMDFGKTKAKITQNVKIRFSDVAGAEEEKQELKEVVDFLKNPKKYTMLGAKIPKGVLLVGPPGTGKTLFAKAVAGEAGVPFFSISGSDFVEMFVGVGASRVRDLFATAKKNMPCIIFIDEIDAVGRHRGAGLGGGNDEREQTLNQLLVQMDGFDANEGIVIMAATNRADILDPALMRPGRFDRQIYVNMPDVRGREEIIKVHARNKPLAQDVNFKTLARMTAGFSGADLANLLNEAAILAARNNKQAITNLDLYEAINKVIIGPQKKSRVVTETDKRITAYHESGHAILARLLPGCDPVQEVSIIPRGPAAGYTLTRPDNDNNHIEKSKLLDDIVMTLGGRVAEEIIIKDISAGASNDISVVTDRARRMVTEWGMSDKIGPVAYGGGDQVFIGKDMQTRATYSEELAKTIDLEIENIIKNAHERATELLLANKSKLDTMARILIERETIYVDEVDMIMDGKEAKEIIAIMEEKDKLAKDNPFARVERKIQNEEKSIEKNPEEVAINITSEKIDNIEQEGEKTEIDSEIIEHSENDNEDNNEENKEE